MTAHYLFRCVAAFVLLLGLFAPAQAYDEAKLKDAERLAILLQAQLRGVAGRIDSGTLQDEALGAQRITLEKIRAAASVGADNASGPLSEISTQVKGLGPPPENGVPELDTIATQRKDLNTQLARATAAQKQFILVGLEAEQVLARLTNLQRSQFLSRIFKADKSILNPTLWTEVWDGAGLLRQRIGETLASGQSARVSYVGFLLVPFGLILVAGFLFRLLPNLLARVGLNEEAAPDEIPSGLSKLWHVIWSYLKYLLLLGAGLVLINASLDATGLLNYSIANLVEALLDAFAPAALYAGLLYFVLSPRQPQWRLVALSSAAARVLFGIVALAYLIYGFGDKISAFASSINMPVSFAVGQTAFSALGLIVLIGFGLVLVRREAAKGLSTVETPYFLTWFVSFMPLWWLLLLIAGVSLLFGFIALSYFIAGNLLDTATLVVALGIVHAFIDALSSAAITPHSRTGHSLRRFTQWSEQGIQRSVLALRTISDAVLVVVGLMALVALWTVVLFDVSSFMTTLSQGISIGNITLSPKALLIGAIVLAIGFTATRYVTRWLDRRVLADTHLDKGVQNSLRAMAGYTGYSLAALFALTAAGLNFSSLAIVFGALGVGIGLGLQSITNNFVSGLILLAERPIRVGDWVVTNAGEGLVRKINVRSTEIETFDNCSIIVPNSNLINNAVQNWTHRDSTGRFAVKFTLRHNTDIDAAQKKLMTIIQAHPKVMRHPPAAVMINQISTQGVEVEMSGHVRDVFEGGVVASEIRLSVLQAIPAADFSSTLPPQAAPARKT